MRTFTLPEPVSGEYNHALVGRIAYDFPAGTVTPASEQEEIVLEEALVPAGLATVDGSGPRVLVAHGFPAETADLAAKTVPELRQVALDEDIELGKEKRKTKIVELITAARTLAAAGEPEPSSGSPDDASDTTATDTGDE